MKKNEVKDVKVNCSGCNKEYFVSKSHYRIIMSRTGKCYCSIECKCRTIEERFWEKVNKTDSIDDCWEWNAGFRNRDSYGTIKYKGKHIDAHRLSWMMANNNFDLTSKDYICHKCDNPKCVNPNHLFLGNAQINVDDCIAKGRFSFTNNSEILIKFQYSENHQPLNKTISNDKMLEIFEYIKNNPTIKIIKVAELFNIKYQALKDARRTKKQSYKNL